MRKRKNKKKVKYFYLDTCIAIDCATGRDDDSSFVMEFLKAKKHRFISSSFLFLELGDFKKELLFIRNKFDEQWISKKILSEIDKKDLNKSELKQAREWIDKRILTPFPNLKIYDLLQTEDDWNLAQRISFETNLKDSDTLHLASAIIAIRRLNIEFLYFLTRDSFLIKEGTKFIKDFKIKGKMVVIDPKSKVFKNKFRIK